MASIGSMSFIVSAQSQGLRTNLLQSSQAVLGLGNAFNTMQLQANAAGGALGYFTSHGVNLLNVMGQIQGGAQGLGQAFRIMGSHIQQAAFMAMSGFAGAAGGAMGAGMTGQGLGRATGSAYRGSKQRVTPYYSQWGPNPASQAPTTNIGASLVGGGLSGFFADKFRRDPSALVAVAKLGGLAYALGTVVDAGAEFEQTMQDVRAVMDVSGVAAVSSAEFRKMGQAAIYLGQNTMYSANEVAVALKEFTLAGFTAKETMELLKPATDFAMAGHLDLARAVEIASTTMRTFNVPAREMGKVMDVIAYGANNSITNVEQMGEALKYSQGVAKNAGLSIEETVAAIMTLSDVGLQGSVAGTTFRNMLKKTSDSSKEAQASMRALGMEFYDKTSGKFKGLGNILIELNNKMKDFGSGAKMQFASDIFEIRASVGMLSLLEHGEKYNRLVDELTKKSKGFSEQSAAMRMDTVAASWTQLKGTIDAISIRLFQMTSGPLKWMLWASKQLAAFGSGPDAPGLFAGTVSGAGAGASAGLLGGMLLQVTRLIPGLGQVVSVMTAIKATALAGGLAGFGHAVYKAIWGDNKNPPTDHFESAIADAKKMLEVSAEKGLDVKAFQQLQSSLDDLTKSILDQAAATRQSIAAGTELNTLHMNSSVYISRQVGNLAVLNEEMKRYKEVIKDQNIIFGQMSTLRGGQEVVDELPIHTFMLESLKSRNDLQNWAEGKASDAKAGKRSMFSNLGEMTGPEVKAAFANIIKFKSVLEEIREVEFQIGRRETMLRPGMLSDLGMWELAKNYLERKELMEKYRDLQKQPNAGRVLQEAPGISALLQASRLEGVLRGIEIIGDQKARLQELSTELAKLGVSEAGLIALRGRIEAIRELQTVTDAARNSNDESIKSMARLALYEEGSRLEVMKTMDLYKKLKEAKAELYRQMLMTNDLKIMTEKTKDIENIKRNIDQVIPIKLYEKQVESIGKVIGDTLSPEEIFQNKISGLQSLLRTPQDITNQLAVMEAGLRSAMTDTGNPERIKIWAEALQELRDQLTGSTLDTGRFKLAAMKAKHELDSALGTGRLAPIFEEGSAAAVSRINQYFAESQDNSIKEILAEANRISSASKENLTEMDRKIGELLRRAYDFINKDPKPLLGPGGK